MTAPSASVLRVLRLFVWLAVVGALGGAVYAETPLLFAGSGARTVERVRGYEVGLGLDPVFALPGGDTLVRLVTNALVPDALGGDDAVYGLVVEVERPDGTVETRSLNLESHRTGARTGTPDPCFDGDGTPIADSRHLDLVLDPPAPPGTLVRVRAVGGTRAIVRAWTWQPRQSETRARWRLALDPDERRDLAEPIGVLSWDHLTEAERERWTTSHFARLAANGRPGEEHVSRDFFVREAVAPPEAAVETPWSLAGPATWLVQGPATVAVTVVETELSTPSTLELVRVAGDEVVLDQWDVGPGTAPHTWTGSFPPGLQTLVLRGSTPTDLKLDVRIPGTAQVPPLPIADAVAAPPAFATLRAAPIGPGSEAVLDAELPDDHESRTVEIEVWGTAPTDPTLTLTVIGARTTVDPVRTALPANAYDVAVDAAGLEMPLRGPQRLKVLLPAGAREVRVGADVGALVRFRVPFHTSEEPPGPPPTVRQVGVADGPAQRSWVRPLAPAEDVAIRVKPRVEPVPLPIPPPPTWVATSLDPSGLVQRFEALERVTGPITGRVLTRVSGSAVGVRAGSGRTRARWSFEVEDSELLGTTVPFLVDGQPAGAIRLAMSRGTVPLPPLAAGDHTVEANPPEGLQLFVNLPPSGDAPAYRARTVWKVQKPVQLTIRTDAEGPRALNIVAYDPSVGPREGVTLEASVDGGTPRRREQGVYSRSTPARRTWTLPAASHPDPAVLVDGDREKIGLPRTLILPLGDDLQPGTHTVTIKASQAMYLRFFAVEPPHLSASTPTWEPEAQNE